MRPTVTTVVCSLCPATSPADAEIYPYGPINWLYRVHWPTAHPERFRAGLDRLREDLEVAS